MKTSLRRCAVLGLLAVLASAPALAQPPPPSAAARAQPGERTVRVEGVGEVRAEPDEAFVDLAVETRAPTAKAAAEQNAKRMEKVIAALTQAGVARKDLDTRGYHVFPEYAPPTPEGREPRVEGYRVSNTLVVHVRDLSKVGALLDRALGAGANRVDGVRFALSRPEAVEAEALRQAVQRARGSAQVLATALGVKLGPVLDASTVSEAPRFFPAQGRMLESADKAAGPTTPILPEAQTIQARVVLIFALE